MKSVMSCLAAAATFLAFGLAHADSVTTLANLNSNGGVTIDSAGDIYAAEYGPLNSNGNPRVVWKLSPTGAFAPFVFADGINVASGNDFDSQDFLFQSAFMGNVIHKIDQDGNVSQFSNEVNGPIGIVIDENDNLFVSNCLGNTISRITPSGTHETYSSSSLYNCPNGITRDANGNLYVINWHSGAIVRIAPDRSVTSIANVSPPGGHLTLARGLLFATSNGGNQVVAFDLNAADPSIPVLTIGSGLVSGADGTFTTAGFNKPNGLTSNAAGDTLYVTDQNGVRRIVFDDPNIVLSRINIDFGSMVVGDTATEAIQIDNNGTGDLVFDAVSLDAADGLSLSADSCSGMAIPSAGSCSLSVTYTPTTATTLGVNLTVDSNDPDESLITIPITATVMPQPAPNVVSPGDIDLGDLLTGTTRDVSVPIENDGTLPLNINAIRLSENGGTPGLTTESFTTTNSCTSIGAGTTCSETLSFHPVTAGDKTAVLEIDSDDPDMPTLQLNITATSSSDSDGVPDSTENGAPNGGDGNSDGMQDAEQDDVTSLPDPGGIYMTLASVDGLALGDVSVVSSPSPGNQPTSVNFDHGFLEFSVLGAPTSAVTVELTFDGGSVPDAFWCYSGEPGNTADHWFDFAYDNTTGAQFAGSTISLQLVDGGRGDADLTVNGTIKLVGGAATTPPAPPPPPPPAPTPASGGGGAFWLLLFPFLLIVRRRYSRTGQPSEFSPRSTT